MFKIKEKLSKVLVLGGCLLVFSTTSAMAAEDTPLFADNPNREIAEIQIQDIYIDEKVLQKQREIDSYLAGEGMKELEQLGFKWTHTGPWGNQVEIGITPYQEEFANFLYDKFGRDAIVVVEGWQAHTMDLGIAPDTPVSHEAVVTDGGNTASPVMDAIDIPNDGREIMVTGSAEIATPDLAHDKAITMSAIETESASNSSLVYYLVGGAGVIILAFAGLLARKRLLGKR